MRGATNSNGQITTAQKYATLNTTNTDTGSGVAYYMMGRLVFVSISVLLKTASAWTQVELATGLPAVAGYGGPFPICFDGYSVNDGWLAISVDGRLLLDVRGTTKTGVWIRSCISYTTSEGGGA